MSKLYKRSKTLVFLLWVISVFLLCTGSLISFHQNKIWGKPLNYELVAVKREAKSLVKGSSDNTGSHGGLTMGFLLFSGQNNFCPPVVTASVRYAEPSQSLLSLPPLINVLRGPPAVI
jgi:hypothetical protein